ncbi:MAG: J domain-containing protein [Alphaproteobacteria bacterium]|nr:J domain-containing protein [Alphaproteobacteria bacterium]MBU6472426.1 J domain-containing protein [Alphaproteobacteria bacterium]MDE2351489.1 J domain-containing protein [Alphaproteobacteria bacterium]
MSSADYRPRFGRDIRIKPDAKPRPERSLRACARPDCPNEGTHRAPKSRDHLGEYLWLCLDHARAHNESWDFFSGMSETEIEAFRIGAVTGHRPTWPLGKRGAGDRHQPGPEEYMDAYGVFADVAEKPGPRAPQRVLTKLQLQSLEMLDLDATATLHQIKARYKELVKRFHPDANGGDRGAEERLKQVIKAYGVLRAAGLT